MAIAFPHMLEDYCNEVLADALAAIEDGSYDSCEDFDDAYDQMWTDDAITGNGSGSYYFNAADAAKAVSKLIWDADTIEGLECDLGVDPGRIYKDGPEELDVSFRCEALGRVYSDIEAAWVERMGKEG